MTTIDYFSKHLRLYSLRNITPVTAVQAMFDYIIIFGQTEMNLSDNGKQFHAHIFDEFHKMLGIIALLHYCCPTRSKF